VIDRKTREVDGWRERFRQLAERASNAKTASRPASITQPCRARHRDCTDPSPGARGHRLRAAHRGAERDPDAAGRERRPAGPGPRGGGAGATGPGDRTGHPRPVRRPGGGPEGARPSAPARGPAGRRQALGGPAYGRPGQGLGGRFEKAQVAREQRLARVSQKVQDRYQRRYQAAEQLRRDQPEAPSGMLAAFKQRAYKEAAAAWSQSFARAGMLEQQAAALCSRVGQAWAKAKSWAYDKLSQTHPALAKRVQDHQQAELRKKIEQQQREREAKRAQQKGRDRGRGR